MQILCSSERWEERVKSSQLAAAGLICISILWPTWIVSCNQTPVNKSKWKKRYKLWKVMTVTAVGICRWQTGWILFGGSSNLWVFALSDLFIIFSCLLLSHHHFSSPDIQTVGAAAFLPPSFFFFFSFSANIFRLFFCSWYRFLLDCGCQLGGGTLAVHPSDLKVPRR